MAKIFVIDDDDLIRTMMVSALRKRGHDVFGASNGNTGLQMAQKDQPDLVITDILMPDKEGIETILELTALYPKLKIIAMSGGGATKNMSFLEMAEKVGAHCTLKKPFKPQTIFDAVDTTLGL